MTKFSNQQLNKWDERFLRIAREVATWSKDPGTCVGAVLVKDRRIIATGYNGFPQGISDGAERYEDRNVKLAYTVHAEVNAILNAARNGSKTNGSTLYVTFSPCVSCATGVIQAGISRVVCPDLRFAPNRWAESFGWGQNLFREAEIEVMTYDPSNYD